MAIISVHNLTLFLAFSCIAATAIICTYLSVDSGDRALDDTKSAGADQLQATRDSCDNALRSTRAEADNAVNGCFGAAENAITARTSELLRATIGTIAGGLGTNFRFMEALVESWHKLILAQQPISYTRSVAWYDAAALQMWSQRMAYSYMGLTALAMYGLDNKIRQIFESGSTVNNQPDEFHHVYLQVSNGEPRGNLLGTARLAGGRHNTTLDPYWDGPEKLPGGRLEPTWCNTGLTSPITGKECDVRKQWGCRSGVALKTNGVVDDGVCRLPTWEVQEQPIATLVQAFFPQSRPRWSHIFGISGFMGFGHLLLWPDEHGKNVAFFFLALDVRSFSRYLSTIQVAGEGATTRIVITVARNWLSDMLPIATFLQTDKMFATSHGNATGFEYLFRTDIGQMGYNQVVRDAVQAEDPIIRGTARHFVHNVPGGFAGGEDTLISYRLNTTLTEGGWSEVVPGALSGDLGVYKAPVNTTIPYLNGRLLPEEEFDPPLPGYARDGDHYFAMTRKINIGRTADDPDGVLWLTLCIDREYVLGETDRQQAATRAAVQEANARVASAVAADTQRVLDDIEASNAEIQDKLERDRIILICVIIAAAIIMMILSIIFVKQIIAPLEELQIDMAAVAVMRLEEVDESKELSELAEVGAMQVSFLQMIRNLREYRSYMPASVLCDDDDEEEEEAEDDKGTKDGLTSANSSGGGDRSKMSGSRQHSGISRNQSMASRRSAESRASKMSGQSMQSKLSMMQNKAAKNKAVGVAKKKVALLAINVCDFSFVCSKLGNPQAIADGTAKYLSAVSNIVQRMKGIPDGFSGDRFYGSFNMVKACASAKTVSVNAGLECVEQGQQVLRSLFPGASDEHGKVQAGASAGDAWCGNLGTDTMKKFCCIGQVAGWVHVCENHCRKMKCFLTCSSVLMDEVGPHVVSRSLVPAIFKGAVHKIHQIIDKAKVSEDEWMYQLEEAAAADPNANFNEAIAAFNRGMFDEAIAAIEADKLERPSPQHDACLYEMRVAQFCAQQTLKGGEQAG
eukprot:TRINITY_DN2157_c0_g1_i1.p1 TRINITY_DN2157_c0_g1~~TRINITY_DN2157_c0_g1_i1.p1  ORF type:complete len:1025 (+),score=316.42 TRINITY_DN2157_c0_g1_i1:150-3224(+)